MNRTAMILSVSLLIAFVAFFIGHAAGKNSLTRNIKNQYSEMKYKVALGRYVSYKDISNSIQNNDIERAKCIADLMASTILDSLRHCVDSKNCTDEFKDELLQKVPEINDISLLSYEYKSSKNGRKDCINHETGSE